MTTPPSRAQDPSGNNGTVKIDGLGDVDRIPNNVPHPGCTFQVEWYGFDGGSDVVSTVDFSMQAPTSGAVLTVDGPRTVPVGGDAASGAGTATGLDAAQAYRLVFTGAPPARQGYHVRLTVSTPRSRGNDTKTKVFWVEPCTTAAAARPATSPAAPTTSHAVTAVPGQTTSLVPGAPQPDMAATTGMTGAFASRAGAQLARSAEASAGVPVAVDAGASTPTLTRWARSPFAWAMTIAGCVLAGAAGALRLRRRA